MTLWRSRASDGTLLENPDDISTWSWTRVELRDLIGTDDCPPDGFFNNCGSFSQLDDGEDIGHVDLIGGGTLLPSNPTNYLLIVAARTPTARDAFRLGYMEETVIPEPGTALLVGAGMWLDRPGVPKKRAYELSQAGWHGKALDHVEWRASATTKKPEVLADFRLRSFRASQLRGDPCEWACGVARVSDAASGSGSAPVAQQLGALAAQR